MSIPTLVSINPATKKTIGSVQATPTNHSENYVEVVLELREEYRKRIKD